MNTKLNLQDIKAFLEGRKLTQRFDEGGQVQPRPNPSSTPDNGPALDPEKVKQFQKGFNSGDVSLSQAYQNIKHGLGFADGGQVPNLSDMSDDDLKALLSKTSDSVDDTQNTDNLVNAPTAQDAFTKPDDGLDALRDKLNSLGDQATAAGQAALDQTNGKSNAPQIAANFPLPNGGLTGQALTDYIKQNPGPVATTGFNPNAIEQPQVETRELASKDDDSDDEDDSDESPAQKAVPQASPVAKLLQQVAQQKQAQEDPNDPFSQGALQQAQNAQKQIMLMSGLGAAGDTIAKAFSKGAYQGSPEYWQNLQKTLGSQPVNNLLQRQQTAEAGVKNQLSNIELAGAKEKEKVDSPVSRSAQQVLLQTAQQAGIKVDPKIISQLPMSEIEKSPLWKAAENANNVKMREELAKQNLLMRQAMLQNQIGNKEQSRYNATVQQLEQMRGAPQVAQAEKDLYAAQKANTLANLYGDPNKLNPNMVKLLHMEVAKIASGGQPSMEELKGLDAGTLNQHLGSIWQKFDNEPTAANAGAFVKQYQDYTNALSKDAQKVINDRYGRIINAKDSGLTPEHQQLLREQYLNRFKNEQAAENASRSPQSSPEATSQDQQAIAWARQNPKDPRAAKILAANGIQ